ncbi:hypothetical protein [Bacillus cereus group sp. BfR-BA-01445]|uniref:hypothetical protein n=1 Tax=Bacillus cereus group sp. BfR-BA-01445 TaxID=2920349 RepID=UPI001F5A042B|nr:hypothetical protein [Bacillus cereus group sp. BfR-BA-01445]
MENEIELFYLLYKDILMKIKHKKYRYMDETEYLNVAIFEGNGVRKGNQIYWKEILLRAHYAAITSLMRNERWVEGIALSIKNKNYILFASSLRGFLESVADSYYSLLNSPFDIAANFKNIKLAIEGKLENPFFMADKLEESLIHFQHAKKGGKKTFFYNQALYTSEYIKNFDKYSGIKTKNLYKILCEVVHPAEDSVNCFTTFLETGTSRYAITDLELDEQNINEVLVTYDKEISQLLKMSISPPFICLKILNLFEFESVESDYLNGCMINDLLEDDVWKKILNLKEKSFEK